MVHTPAGWAGSRWERPGSAVRTVASMLVSYVVRLVTEALEEGRVAGEVQSVTTGERQAVRDSEELIAVLLSCGTKEQEE